MSDSSRLGNATIFVFFFGSGFSALLYQVVWLKYLNLLLGSTVYATVAVLSAFMFGLSAGSMLASRLGSLYRFSLRSYGIVEMGVGIFAMFFNLIYIWLKTPFSLAFNLVGPEAWIYNLVAFLVAFLVLVIPTSLMGASLPLLAHYLVSNKDIPKSIGNLYAVNTAGAVVGIIVSAFLLIPKLGLGSTVYVGVLINLIVGGICYLTGTGETPHPPVRSKVGNSIDPLLYYYAISGLLALGYEVLWTRILVLHLGSSVYAYSLMLATFLLGISLGSFLSGRFLVRKKISSEMLFGWIQLAWAFSILLQIVQFTHLSDTLYELASSFTNFDLVSHFLTQFASTFQILLLPTFLSGALFPIMVERVHKSGMEIREASGVCYSYNTFGGIFGAILVGFLFIPLFGTQWSLVFLGFINMLLGVLAILKDSTVKQNFRYALILSSIVVFAFAAFFITSRFNILRSAGIFKMEGNEKLIRLQEDVTSTISVEERRYLGSSFLSLSVNGVNVAGTAPNLISIQKMQAHLPMILFGPTRQKSVLHIGLGSGGTAYSASLYPNTKITVVEMCEAIVKNANDYFPMVNHGILNSKVLEFIFFDGRSYVQNTSRKFDVILSDSIHPRYSGNGSLYTKDYYKLVYERLNPGGVHSQWLPLYSLTSKNFKEILRAFEEVFPETSVWYINSSINPFVIIIGQKKTAGVQLSSMKEALSIPKVRADLKEIGIQDEYALMDYFLFGKHEIMKLVQEVEPHVDDRMTVEYESSRVIQRELSWLYNFQELVALRTPILEYSQPTGWFNTDLYDQYYIATGFNLKGQLLFLERKPKEAKRAFAEARRLNESDRDPYEFDKVKF